VKGEINPQMVNLKDEIVSQMVVEVFNLLGQKVYANIYQEQINLSHLNHGVYLMKISNNYSGQTMVEKLIISK